MAALTLSTSQSVLRPTGTARRSNCRRSEAPPRAASRLLDSSEGTQLDLFIGPLWGHGTLMATRRHVLQGTPTMTLVGSSVAVSHVLTSGPLLTAQGVR